MSTKIYTGFRLRSPSWKAAHAGIAEFREEVEAHYHRINCKSMSVHVCRAVDEAAIRGEKPPDSVVVDALMDLNSRWGKVAPSFDIVLFPHGRLIYGMTFGDWHHSEVWLGKPCVERWGYWNNTDRPDEVTAREWRHRQKTWDAILGGNGYGTPAECGFLAQCLPKYPRLPSWREVLPLIPPIEERVEAHAKRVILAARYGIADPDKADAGNWMRAVEGTREWLGTDEGRAALEAEKSRIGPLLAPEITPEMIGVKP